MVEFDLDVVCWCEVYFVFEQEGCVVFVGLVVYVDYCVVVVVEICWVDWQVWYFLDCIGVLLCEVFVDCVLV